MDDQFRNKTPCSGFGAGGLNVQLGPQIDKSTAFLKVGSPLFLGSKLTKVAFNICYKGNFLF